MKCSRDGGLVLIYSSKNLNLIHPLGGGEESRQISHKSFKQKVLQKISCLFLSLCEKDKIYDLIITFFRERGYLMNNTNLQINFTIIHFQHFCLWGIQF